MAANRLPRACRSPIFPGLSPVGAGLTRVEWPNKFWASDAGKLDADVFR